MEQIIDNLIQSFDFGYCAVVNIVTYLLITSVYETMGITLTKWKKRIVLVCSIVAIAAIYIAIGADIKVLVNSSILAPVSWSWVFKPICKHFNIDYKHED